MTPHAVKGAVAEVVRAPAAPAATTTTGLTALTNNKPALAPTPPLADASPSRLLQTLPRQKGGLRYVANLARKRPHHPATTFATASRLFCTGEAFQRSRTLDTRARSTLHNDHMPRGTAPHTGLLNFHVLKEPPNQRVVAPSPSTPHDGQSQLPKGTS